MTKEDIQEVSNDITKSPLKVIYVAHIGTNTDGENIYHFLISTDKEKTWAEGWENKPACLMRDLTPEEDMYEYVAEVKTFVKLDLAQESCCYTMQDARDSVIALAYENLDEAEDYPDEGRIVIHFGDLVEDVEKFLAKRDIVMNYI
jgi:hypothetical protein